MTGFRYAVSAAEVAPVTAPLPLTGKIEDIISTAAELGYNGIELHTREDVPFDYDNINLWLSQQNVKLVNIVTGRINTEGHLSLLDADGGAKCLDGLKKYVDMAAKFGADIVLGWAKGKISCEDKRDEELCLLAKNLKELAEYAENKGVKVNVELINRYETNIFNTVDEFLSFMQKYDIPNCYAHIDTFHMNIEEGDVPAAIKKLGKYLGYVHIADNQRHYPGSGSLDFEELLKVLKDVGYEGFINVECLPIPGRIEAAKNAIAHMKMIERKI